MLEVDELLDTKGTIFWLDVNGGCWCRDINMVEELVFEKALLLGCCGGGGVETDVGLLRNVE